MSRYLPFSTALDWTPPEPPDLSRFDEIELDGEFTGLDWVRGDRPVGWAVGTPAGTTYLPFAHRGGQNLDEQQVKRWAERELRGKRIRNHSVKVDAHFMRAWGVDLVAQGCTFHDVAHSAALLDDHRRVFTLEALAQAELGEGKADVGPPAGIADLPGGTVAPYAEQDVALVRRLADVYAPKIRAEGLATVAQLEEDIIPVGLEMEANGMPLDMELLTQQVESSRVLAERLAYDLHRTVGFTVNPDSPSDMTRLFQTCNESVTRTASGRGSFTAPIVQAAAARHQSIELAWRLGKLIDLRNKYLVKYLKDQVGGVLYPTLHQLKVDDGGTVSGRFSCVRPNMQQIMGAHKHARAYGWLTEYGTEDYLIKRLFRPAQGAWGSADMKQVEFRVFVHYSESARLLSAYREDPNTDFHVLAGHFIRQRRADLDRTQVKSGNFAFLYGGSSAVAVRMYALSEQEAADLYDVYHESFPEVQELNRRAMTVANRRGYVKTFLGRRCRFHGTFGKRERVHKALNGIVQGTAADANKLALVDLYRRRHELGITMRMTVHDSLEVDLHEPETLPAYAAALNEQRLALRVPLLWDVKTGPTWGDC